MHAIQGKDIEDSERDACLDEEQETNFLHQVEYHLQLLRPHYSHRVFICCDSAKDMLNQLTKVEQRDIVIARPAASVLSTHVYFLFPGQIKIASNMNVKYCSYIECLLRDHAIFRENANACLRILCMLLPVLVGVSV
jgi:acyl transferase domain-containing protein